MHLDTEVGRGVFGNGDTVLGGSWEGTEPEMTNKAGLSFRINKKAGVAPSIPVCGRGRKLKKQNRGWFRAAGEKAVCCQNSKLTNEPGMSFIISEG